MKMLLWAHKSLLYIVDTMNHYERLLYLQWVRRESQWTFISIWNTYWIWVLNVNDYTPSIEEKTGKGYKRQTKSAAEDSIENY